MSQSSMSMTEICGPVYESGDAFFSAIHRIAEKNSSRIYRASGKGSSRKPTPIR